jgi:MFS family permease
MAPPTPPEVSPRDRHLILIMAILANLLGNLGLTGINMGLPDMGRELGLSAAMMGWITLSMFMPMAAIAAPGARLADIWGRRRTTTLGLAACLLGLIVSALAWDVASLLASRVITGLGLAVVFTNLTAMATSVYPPQMRGRVLGYTISSVYIGLSLGPVTCGYLVNAFGWRAIFWLSFIGFLPSFIISLLVRLEQSPARGEAFDKTGAALWAAAILSIFWGLTHLTNLPDGPLSILAGLALAYGYVRHSLKSDVPILDVQLFAQNRRFAFSSLAAFISYSASMGLSLILSLYLQYIKGMPPHQAGLVLMVQPVCQALVTPFAGRLSDKIDAGIMASLGMLILSAGIAIMGLVLTPATSIPVFVGLLAALGVGFSIFSAPNSNAIIGSAPPEKVGQASGTITATRLCGQVFSIALTTLIFSLIIGPGRITPDKYPAFMQAATICFFFFAPICFTGILASMARGKKSQA